MAFDRRQFLTTMVLTGVATAAAGERPFASAAALTADEPAQPAFNAAIDFRYSPCHWQATFGFPDDKYKSLVGDGGELKYDFPQDKFADPDQFGSIIIHLAVEPDEPCGTPTRFGRISLQLEPLGPKPGWSLRFARDSGSPPQAVQVPLTLGTRWRFCHVEGAGARSDVRQVQIDPASPNWVAYWS